MNFNKKDKLLILKAFEVKEYECGLEEREKEIMLNIAKELDIKRCGYNEDTQYIECPVEDFDCEKCKYYIEYFISTDWEEV